MKLTKHKKGGYLEIIVVVGLAILLGWTFSMLATKYEGLNKKVGEKQLDLFTVYGEGEKALLYVDMSAALSAKQALYDLGVMGGIPEECESYLGYRVWDRQKPQCYPAENNAKTNFKKWLTHNLNKHFATNRNTLFYSPSSNYQHYSLTPPSIIGIASSKIEFSTITDKEIVPDKAYEEQQAATEKQYSSKLLSSQGFVSIDKQKISCSGSCTLNAQAYARLLAANEEAKKLGFEIHVYSSYRSMEQQIALWEGKTPERYAQRYPDPAERSKYVANPYAPGAAQRNTHFSGKAVDVRRKDKSNSQMTPSDWKRLEEVMYNAGWVRYSNEAWHFEYDTERWARAKAEEQKTGKEVRALV
jgi:D-alanyl-D-alanine dipeptidase